MPAPMTDKQQAFVLEYARNGGNASAAARVAGYPEKSAHEQGRQQLEKPHIREAIHRELMKLRYRSGAIGLSALISIAQNEDGPAAARVAAARALIEHAGISLVKSDVACDEPRANVQVADYQSVLRGLAEYRRQRQEAS